MLKKLIPAFWSLSVIFLFLYSFTQVDLGLTFSRASILLDTLKAFQYVGYFNRPLSAYLASGIFIILFVLYSWTLRSVVQKKLQEKTVWLIIFFTSIVLLFSYNAFSYDIFNYLFDAKIVTEYGQNPYVKKALDFPGDPYLGFMHWTHRTYPYGPIWLGLTIPLSFLGMKYFIITFYLFKLLMGGSYLASCYVIYKIAKKLEYKNPLVPLSFFALNPLVIVESLVASHNDIVMIMLMLLGVYFLLVQKKFTSWIFLLLSVGIKFATGFLLPLFLWYPFSKNKSKNNIFMLVGFILMVIATILVTFRTNFQPWYLLYPLPFAAFILDKRLLFIPVSAAIISSLALFQYIPFLYTGNFDPPIPEILNYMLWGSIILALCVSLVMAVLKKDK